MGRLEKISGKLLQRIDAFQNTFAGLGSALHDKGISATFAAKGASDVGAYEDWYNEHPLARRICDLPAGEMLRQGFKIEVDGDSETDSLVRGKFADLDATSHITHAIALARATGGSAIILGLDDGQEDASQPLKEESLRSLRWMVVLSRRNVETATYYDKTTEKYGQPETYKVKQPNSAGGDDTYLIHESRVIRFDGAWVAPSRRAKNGGWGDSVFVQLEEAIKRVDSSFAAIGAMIPDASQGVFKIKNLLEIIQASADNEAAIRTRLRLMDYSRSVARAVAIDADSEDFTYQDRSFAGISDAVSSLCGFVSAYTGIPQSLLFGRSPSGLNATGETDVRFFYDSMQATQVNELKPRLQRLLRLIMISKEGPTGGNEPEKWEIEFTPLMQMSEAERADIRLKTAQADQLDIANQVLTPEEVTLSRYGGDKYSTSTTVDLEAHASASDTLSPDTADTNVQPTDQAQAAAQPQTLNGAQVSSMLEIINAVAQSMLPRDTGVFMLEAAFGVDPQVAEKIMGEVGRSFKPAEQNANASQPTGPSSTGDANQSTSQGAEVKQ